MDTAPDSIYHPGLQGRTGEIPRQAIMTCSVRIIESRDRSRTGPLNREPPLGGVEEHTSLLCAKALGCLRQFSLEHIREQWN